MLIKLSTLYSVKLNGKIFIYFNAIILSTFQNAEDQGLRFIQDSRLILPFGL
jgi:hypothetical protein